MSLMLIIPTRGRPQNAVELIAELRRTMRKTTTRVVFACDEDDPMLAEYQAIDWGQDWRISMVTAERLKMNGTLNKWAVTYAHDHEVVGFMGDDHRPRTVGWDYMLEGILITFPGVAYGNDLLQGRKLATASFISSKYILKMGFYSPPRLIHLYLDNFWMELGRATNLHYLDHVVIEHMHYTNGKAEQDAGYVEVNSDIMYNHDKAEFSRFMSEDWSSIRASLRGI